MVYNFYIDPVNRIVSGDKMTVLKKDHNIHTMLFTVADFEGFTFDSASILIKAVLPDKTEKNITPENITVEDVTTLDDEGIEVVTGHSTSFEWTLKHEHTDIPGAVTYSICAALLDSNGNIVNKEWHTLNASINVQDHIHFNGSDDAADPEQQATNAERIAALLNTISSLVVKVNGLASGAPPTAASTAEMDPGKSSIYVNSTDGNLYFWSGAEWQVGGQYGAAMLDSALDEASDNPVKNRAIAAAIEQIRGDINTLDDRTWGVTMYQGLLYITKDGARIGTGIAVASDAVVFDNVTFVDGYLHFTNGGTEISGSPFYIGEMGGGLAFNSGYQDEEGYIHLTMDGQDLSSDVFTPFQISGGGGGGGSDSGSTMTVAMITSAVLSIVDTAVTCPISARWSSVDSATSASTGSGTLTVTVGGTQKLALSVAQGEVTVDVREYMVSGTNTVKFTFTDSYGKSVSRTWTISMESFGLTWSLSDVQKNTDADLTFYVTPVGSGEKTIYIYVDGQLFSTDTVSTSGRRLTKSITGLTHGDHAIEAYGTLTVGGVTIESDHLHSTVAQIVAGASTPVIAVNWPTGDLTQYTTFDIKYLVIDPASNPVNVSLLVDGVVQATVPADQSEKTWSYRPMTAGTFTFGIMCGSSIETHDLTISSIGSDIAEVTDSLEVKVDPSMISDLTTWRHGSYGFTLSENFDLVNGGVQTDSEGVPCIRVTAGDRLTLNYMPFFGADVKRTGKELKLVYKIADCSSKTAVGISCKNGRIGFTCEANNVYASGNATSVSLSTCEDKKVELDINIQQDREDSLIYIWEGCSTFSYAQYGADESFNQTTAAGITFGSDDADVYLYLVRGYSRDLTNEEMMSNFIADGKNGVEILARNDRNSIYDSSNKLDINAIVAKCPDVDVYRIDAERMTHGKKDYVTGRLRHWQGASDYHNWTADMTMSIQGTSSVEHADTAGGNLNFVLSNIVCENGTALEGWAFNGVENSIPTNMINFKKNIASEEHIVNVATAHWYNTYQQSRRAARTADPRVRDCLEGKMAIVFFHNTSSAPVQVGPDTVAPDETIFFGLGNTCSNKDAAEVFQYDPIVIEVKNNTEPQVRFKTTDLTGDNFDNNYEFRYLDEDQYTETQAKALWQEIQNFVYETDWTAATNAPLSPIRTVGGQAFSIDSAEYRKARWTAEAADHFDMDTLYFHHNITLLLLLRDNRAKNMFWSYNTSKQRWGLWFNWDNDTGLCRNNRGYIDMEPGYMDFDTLGTADVFNGADNAVFTSLRECNWSQLQASYLAMESAGATDIDAFYGYCNTMQSQIPESLWIEDAEHNAIRVMQNLGSTAYLGRATGRLRLHLYKALQFQRALVDSYYVATAATAGSAAIRGYTPTEWAGVRPSGMLSVTPYTNIYVNVLAGSTPYKVRAYEGQSCQLDISAALNDTEIYLRSAEWIQELGDMSGLYLGQFEAANMKRVRTLLIGSEVEGYRNTSFRTISFTNCRNLKTLCLGGMVAAAQAFDFSSNIYLEYIYTKGSGITGITFAPKGRLKTAHLNALVSLTMKGLNLLETFDMESYEALSSVTVEDSPAVDSYALVAAAVNIARVRMLDIDWNVQKAAYDVLRRLHSAYGIDDDGYNTPAGVVTGDVHFVSIAQSKYTAITALMPEISFTYGELLQEVTVTFQNYDGTVLYTTMTEVGGSVADPVSTGLIQAPTKAPTVEKTYTFYNWSQSLDSFTQNTTVTAVYNETTRQYTVRYLDYDDTVLETYTVPVYGSTSYQGRTLTREGYIWVGFDTDTSSITADTDVHAKYDYPILPATNHYSDMADFDYAYSDDPNDTSAYTFGELYAIIKTGQAADYLPVKSEVKMVPNSDVITDTHLIFGVHSYGHYAKSDGTGMSGCDFFMTHLLIGLIQMQTSNNNAGGWNASVVRGFLNVELYPSLPSHWKQLIVQTVTLASAGAKSSDILSTNDWLRIPSYAELGWGFDASPYKDEIDSRASELTFSQYTTNATRTKKTYYGTGSATSWWTRSAVATNTTSFQLVSTSGAVNGNNYATNAQGICAGFSA